MFEKRKWPRFACLEICEMQPGSDSAQKQSPRVLNYSYNGLLLETDMPLGRGQYVKIDVLGKAMDKALTGLGRRIGRVRWCSTRPERPSGCFSMGIEMLGAVSDEALSCKIPRQYKRPRQP
jgi:hypothetical protein